LFLEREYVRDHFGVTLISALSTSQEPAAGASLVGLAAGASSVGLAAGPSGMEGMAAGPSGMSFSLRAFSACEVIEILDDDDDD
jgi:hypothetical protein